VAHPGEDLGYDLFALEHEAMKGEAIFAASNFSLFVIDSDRYFLFGTGGPEGARIIRCEDDADEEPFRPADVAEPIRILILTTSPTSLGAALAKPVKSLVDAVNREHDVEVLENQVLGNLYRVPLRKARTCCPVLRHGTSRDHATYCCHRH